MTCLKPEGAQPAARGAAGLDFNPFEIMQPRAPGAVPLAQKNGRPVKEADVTPDGVYRPDYRIMTPNMR